MANLPPFLSATLGDALAVELTLLIALVVIIEVRRLLAVAHGRFFSS